MILLTFTADADLDIPMAIACAKEYSMKDTHSIALRYRGYTLCTIDAGFAIYAIGHTLGDNPISTSPSITDAKAIIDNWVEGSVR